MFKRLYYYLGFILLILSCTPNESEKGNKPPSDFEIYVNASVYNNVQLSWSESFDPEEEEIFYAIYLNGSLIESKLSGRLYTFKNLNPSENYSGQIVAYDLNDNQTFRDFEFFTASNGAPSSFELNSVVSDNISAFVEWTNSIDLENENVVYNIFLDETLVEENYTRQYYNFENLIANTVYNVRIVAKDESGNETFLDFEMATADGVYRGDLSLRNQQGIEQFGAKGYIEITGNLEIYGGYGGTSDIVDLAPLKTIKKVRGIFSISFCYNLKSISGIEVEHIGKGLRINNNYFLEQIEGFHSLKELFGNFTVDSNGNLKTISGFGNLESIGNGIIIKSNGNLLSVSGFEKVTFLESLYVNNNAALSEITGFNLLKEMGGSSITENPNLISISAFNKLNTIGSFYFKDTLLENLDMFSDLEIVNGVCSISNNSELLNIKGLNALTKINYGNLTIGSNAKLESLEGLENLVHIGGTLSISNNKVLTDFCALTGVLQNFNPEYKESIINNAFNPTITQIANGECSKIN